MTARMAALAVLILIAGPAHGEGGGTDEGAFLAMGFGGGTAATATVFDGRAVRKASPAFSAGFGEVEFGYRGYSGLGLAFTAQSLSLRGLSRHGVDPQDWTGGAAGITGSWQYRRFDAWVGLLTGSVTNREWTDEHFGQPQERQHNVAGGKAGLGFALYKGDNVDWRLTASVEPLVVAGELADGERMGRKLYLQQAGLGVTIHPRLGGASGGDSRFTGSFGCWSCGDLVYWSGKALLEAGSALGRATADGLFRALAR